MQRFNEGDRIRLTSFRVTIQQADGNAVTVPVNLRHSWDGPRPSHYCVASTCDECLDIAESVAARKVARGVGKTAALLGITQIEISVIRDRQAFYRPPNAPAQAAAVVEPACFAIEERLIGAAA